MFDHLLESSQRDDSNKWLNIEIGEEIRRVESIEVHFTHLIWSSGSHFIKPSRMTLLFDCLMKLIMINGQDIGFAREITKVF